jgi:hypothetical protein
MARPISTPDEGRDKLLSIGRERLVFSLLLFFASIAGLMVALAPKILPPKYFYDSRFVQSIAQKTNYILPDPSYASTGALYRSIGLSNAPLQAGLLAVAVFFVAVFLAMAAAVRSDLSPSTVSITCLSFLLGGIYLGTYSKDAVVLVAVVALLWLSQKRHAMISMAAFSIAYASIFRTYWILVAVSFLLFEFACRRSISARRLILGTALSLAFADVAVRIVYSEDLSTFRQAVNISRLGSQDAVTVIPQYIGGNGLFAGWLNSLVTLATLLVPVPLFLLASPIYIASGGFLAFLTYRSGKLVRLLRKLELRRPGESKVAERARHCFLMTLSLLVVQSIYVPDYGSALKHLTPLLPILIAALAGYDTLVKEVLMGNERAEQQFATIRSRHSREFSDVAAVLKDSEA